MLKKILKFILIILCMATIFYFSSESGEESSDKSDGIIVKTAEFFLNKKLDSVSKEKYINKYVVLIRKGAHFTIYSILGILLISFIGEFRTLNRWSIYITVLIVFLYAISDEIHQTFIPGRSGELKDILLDSFGGFFASSLYLYLYKHRRG